MTSTTQYRVDTEWGAAMISCTNDGLPVALDPPGDDAASRARDLPDAPPPVQEFAANLQSYFAGEPVDLAGGIDTAAWLDAAGVRGFHRDVLLALTKVPWGCTVTYGELAELAGRPRATRAAGTACARNPLPIVVPCHRVLPASGGVGNFGFAGPAYKERLLALEGR